MNPHVCPVSPVKILLAPNALKGSLSAAEAAEAMGAGIRRYLPDAEIRSVPIADGGDGLIEALAAPLAAERRSARVSGPLGEPVQAGFLYCAAQQLAVIEMATASGLALLPPERLDALAASSRGTGELMRAALDLGCRHLVLGIGGSATSDGGTGLASALGMRFLDTDGHPVAGNGAGLSRIAHIDRSACDPRLREISLDVACDVDNPLLGARGAAQVYGPQKGAGAGEVERIEQGLANLAAVIERDLGTDVRTLSGGGAAGGAGAGLMAFFGATLKPGAELVIELLGLEAALADADLVLTCEGRLDEQTRFGKAPAAVAALAGRHGVPCIAIAGMLDESQGSLNEAGFDAVFSLCPGPVPLAEAIDNAALYLQQTAHQVVRCQQIPPRRIPHT